MKRNERKKNKNGTKKIRKKDEKGLKTVVKKAFSLDKY
jgi:hypothetical protein